MRRGLLRVFASRVVYESRRVGDLISCSPSSNKRYHVIGGFESLQFLSDSFTSLLISSRKRRWMQRAYPVIFDADLRHCIGECPHDILHHDHPVLLQILDVLQDQLVSIALDIVELTSQNPLHSASHFCVVPSRTLTNCLKSCSFPPMVWRTRSSLACTFSRSFPCDKAEFAVYELSFKQSDSYFSLA